MSLLPHEGSEEISATDSKSKSVNELFGDLVQMWSLPVRHTHTGGDSTMDRTDTSDGFSCYFIRCLRRCFSSSINIPLKTPQYVLWCYDIKGSYAAGSAYCGAAGKTQVTLPASGGIRRTERDCSALWSRDAETGNSNKTHWNNRPSARSDKSFTKEVLCCSVTGLLSLSLLHVSLHLSAAFQLPSQQDASCFQVFKASTTYYFWMEGQFHTQCTNVV